MRKKSSASTPKSWHKTVAKAVQQEGLEQVATILVQDTHVTRARLPELLDAIANSLDKTPGKKSMTPTRKMVRNLTLLKRYCARELKGRELRDKLIKMKIGKAARSIEI